MPTNYQLIIAIVLLRIRSLFDRQLPADWLTARISHVFISAPLRPIPPDIPSFLRENVRYLRQRERPNIKAGCRWIISPEPQHWYLSPQLPTEGVPFRVSSAGTGSSPCGRPRVLLSPLLSSRACGIPSSQLSRWRLPGGGATRGGSPHGSTWTLACGDGGRPAPHRRPEDVSQPPPRTAPRRHTAAELSGCKAFETSGFETFQGCLVVAEVVGY